MITVEDIMEMNIEEVFSEALKENWDMETLQAWTLFKIAQYLEKIAYKEPSE